MSKKKSKKRSVTPGSEKTTDPTTPSLEDLQYLNTQQAALIEKLKSEINYRDELEGAAVGELTDQIQNHQAQIRHLEGELSLAQANQFEEENLKFQKTTRRWRDKCIRLEALLRQK